MEVWVWWRREILLLLMGIEPGASNTRMHGGRRM
jgi:hypothetical protein